MKDIRIIPFDERYVEDFVRLNTEWIETHFRIEPMDVAQLKNPKDHILALGGEIFFLVYENRAIGTCALIPHGHRCFELAKMAVDPQMRGHGYGENLMLHALKWAEDHGAKKVMLLSNTVLKPAITLYKKVGFKTIHLGNHPDYDRCNIEMEIELP